MSDPLDDLIRASARALDLEIEPAWTGAVTGNLEMILRFAAMVGETPLPDEAEPAPVFTA